MKLNPLALLADWCSSTHLAVILGTASLLPAPAFVAAHEFWIEPLQFQSDPSARILATVRNGENFTGNNFPYIPERFSQFTIFNQQDNRDISSRLGDLPAVHEVPEQAGLHVLVYASLENVLKYETFDKFSAFAKKEDLEWLLTEHREQNLPEQNITELFYRYAKSLVAVGSGKGQDQFFNLPLELVALTNPYQYESSQGVQVIYKLFLDGQALPDTQVSVFHKDENDVVTSRLYRTDIDGQVTIDATESGSYLLNSVVAHQAAKSKMLKYGALWETYWASSTFGVVANN